MNQKLYLPLLLLLGLQSCSEDPIPITITAEGLEITIPEKPDNNAILGTITAETNVGEVSFAIQSSTPSGAFNISDQGEVSVADRALFDFEVNPIMTATVAITNGDAQETVNVTVNLLESVSFSRVTSTMALFDGRYRHQAVAYNGELFIIGGLLHPGGFNIIYDDVWSTTDGNDWTFRAGEDHPTSTSFPDRYDLYAHVFDDKLFVLGGQGETSWRSDIYFSLDGETWANLRADLTDEIFYPRVETAIAELNGKLWLVGGRDGLGVKNDIWSTEDGRNWTLEQPQGEIFVGRIRHQLLSFKGKLWLFGGQDAEIQATALQDTWSSPDGVTWTQEADGNDILARGASMVVFDDKIWLIGGYDNPTNYDEVWVTEDGINWKQLQLTGTPFSGRGGHSLTVFENTIWMIGGEVQDENGNEMYVNDVWKMDLD